jgi:hypothetical protein
VYPTVYLLLAKEKKKTLFPYSGGCRYKVLWEDKIGYQLCSIGMEHSGLIKEALNDIKDSWLLTCEMGWKECGQSYLVIGNMKKKKLVLLVQRHYVKT